MTFLEQLRDSEDTLVGDEPGHHLVNQDLVTFLEDASDQDLTRWLLEYRDGRLGKRHTPETGIELYRLAERFDTSGHWLNKAIESRILDRWMEENS